MNTRNVLPKNAASVNPLDDAGESGGSNPVMLFLTRNALIEQRFRALVSRFEIETVFVREAHEWLEAIATRDPDVALIDTETTEATATRALLILRSIPSLAPVPVVVIATEMSREIVALRDRFEAVRGIVYTGASDHRILRALVRAFERSVPNDEDALNFDSDAARVAEAWRNSAAEADRECPRAQARPRRTRRHGVLVH